MPRNVATSVKTLYRTEPKNLPKGCEKGLSPSTVPEAQHSLVTEPTTIPIPTPKTTDGKKGANVGLIVGAVVGSVGGCGLIAAALFLGIRIGRRRSIDQPETRPSRSIRERLQSLPRPVVSLAWRRPPRAEIGEITTTMQPTAVNSNPAELDASSNQLPAERAFVSGAEGKPPTQTWG